jgi:hypothetical protein
MSEIVVPESVRKQELPDIDYAIARLDSRVRHIRNECLGDILLPNDVVMDIGLDALRYTKARIEGLEGDLKEAYVMIGLCLTGHWPRGQAEALWQRLHDYFCEGPTDAALAAEKKP